MTNDLEAFGVELKRLRLLRRLSQGQVAKLAGISGGYLSELENGKGKRPGGKIVADLARVLNADVGELMGVPSNARTSTLPSSLDEIFARLAVPGRRALVEIAGTIERLEQSYQPPERLEAYLGQREDSPGEEDETPVRPTGPTPIQPETFDPIPIDPQAAYDREPKEGDES